MVCFSPKQTSLTLLTFISVRYDTCSSTSNRKAHSKRRSRLHYNGVDVDVSTVKPVHGLSLLSRGVRSGPGREGEEVM